MAVNPLWLRLPRQLGPDDVAHLDGALGDPGDVVVLAGGDDAFCEGLRLDRGGVPDPTPFASLLARIDAQRRPVVALVDGAALGGGCALAAAADLVLATPRAAFGLPEVLWGLIPAAALPTVARRVGAARARLLALGIPAIDADEALRWGLVDARVPDVAGAERHLRRLGRADPRAVAAMKALAPLIDTPEYLGQAVAQFTALAASGPTCGRLRRLARGEAPWEDR